MDAFAREADVAQRAIIQAREHIALGDVPLPQSENGQTARCCPEQGGRKGHSTLLGERRTMRRGA